MSVTTHIHSKKVLTAKRLLATSIGLAIASFSNQSIAQEQETEEAKGELEVIMVTAQKRQQNIMKVPVTVDTVSADTLKKTNSILLSEIDKFVPGFNFSEGNMTQAGIEMRGISSPNISIGGDPSSASFFDDVYMPRAAQNVIFSDMARIEVLKGPQGTLFGRNAAMGVVNMVPNSPAADTEGFVKGIFGTDNLMRYEAMGNIAITDTFFVRVNALMNEQDGLAENISNPSWNNGTKIWDPDAKGHNAARVAAKWVVSDVTNFQLSYDFDDLEQAPPQSIGVSQYAYNGGQDIFANKVENDVRNGVESREMSAITAKLDHEFNDAWSMKFVASYRDWETVNREDEDGTQDISRYFDTSNNEDSSITYTELQLNYLGENVNVVTGFSYSKEDVSQTTELNISADAAARLITGELNGVIRQGVAGEIASLINVEAFGGDYDAAAANAFGAGVSFEDAVDAFYATSGFPIEHMWDSNQWAGALNALGFGDAIMAGIGMPGVPLTGDIVAATGDVTYDLVAQQMGIAELFGPSASGQFWEERVNNTGDFTNWGIYFDADWKIDDKWNILTGLRYSKDEKDFTWHIPETNFAESRPGIGNLLFQPTRDSSGNVTTIKASDSWDKITGRLVAQYQLDDNHMFFGSYSTGYKAGGYDSLVVTSAQNPFKPEDTTNIEFGYKGVAWDVFRATVSTYYLTLDNRQRSVDSKKPDSNQAIPTIINGDTTIQGLEVGFDWAMSSTVNLGLVTEIRSTDAEWEEFYNAEGTLVPKEKNSGKAAMNYTLRFDWLPDLGVGNTSVHVDYVFLENTRREEVGLEEYKKAIPAYFRDTKDLNARISWENEDDTIEIGLWAKNLFDERYALSVGGVTANVLGTPFARINRGREVGIDFKYSF